MTTLITKNQNEVEKYLNEHKSIKVNLNISVLFYKTNGNIDVKDIKNYVKNRNLKELDEQSAKIKDVEVIFGIMYFNTNLKPVINGDELYDSFFFEMSYMIQFDRIEAELSKRVDEFTQHGSGWVELQSIDKECFRRSGHLCRADSEILWR